MLSAILCIMQNQSDTRIKPEIIDYSGHYYYPKFECLEKLVIFPDGETRKKGIPNSSVWVFSEPHKYEQDILSADAGCGITGFLLPEIDYKQSADIIAEYLQDKGILGRGNHFVDLCSPIISHYGATEGSIMLVHTDGKYANKSVPSTVDAAITKAKSAIEFRQQLAYDIASMLGVDCHLMVDWTHNFVEKKEGKIIYRKGAIKTFEGKLHILPAHIGRDILVYTVDSQDMPPLESMPHGTGRKLPIYAMKNPEFDRIILEELKKLRSQVYIPLITDESLRSEAPLCYNDFNNIFEKLVDYIVTIGHIDIKAYIGKI